MTPGLFPVGTSHEQGQVTMFTKSTLKVSSVSVFSYVGSLASSLATLVACAALAGCAADAQHSADGSVRDQKQTQDVGQTHDAPVGGGLFAPVTLDESDSAKTVDVARGQAIVVRLPSNATTGYEWKVSSDVTALGEPHASYEPEGNAAGSGGSTSFIWSDTKTVAAGHYAITLSYKRSWEPSALDTFSFVVAIDR
jgi:inhibitor of cysteine peptidase